MSYLETILSWAATPLLGWGWNVERRLGKVEEKLDGISRNTNLLVEHLIIKGVDAKDSSPEV